MERHTTVDDVLRRWQNSRDQNKPATIEELCAGALEDPAELRERLQAVASMMSFLGVEAEAGPIGARSTEGTLSAGAPPTVVADGFGLGGSVSVADPSVRIPGYEVLGELGRGGMGVVYKARQQSLDRIVAIKMVLAASHAGATAISRFLQEAKTIALLKHPHVVQVYDYGSHEGKPFFSLEYLEGGSLADRSGASPNLRRRRRGRSRHWPTRCRRPTSGESCIAT